MANTHALRMQLADMLHECGGARTHTNAIRAGTLNRTTLAALVNTMRASGCGNTFDAHADQPKASLIPKHYVLIPIARTHDTMFEAVSQGISIITIHRPDFDVKSTRQHVSNLRRIAVSQVLKDADLQAMVLQGPAQYRKQFEVQSQMSWKKYAFEMGEKHAVPSTAELLALARGINGAIHVYSGTQLVATYGPTSRARRHLMRLCLAPDGGYDVLWSATYAAHQDMHQTSATNSPAFWDKVNATLLGRSKAAAAINTVSAARERFDPAHTNATNNNKNRNGNTTTNTFQWGVAGLPR